MASITSINVELVETGQVELINRCSLMTTETQLIIAAVKPGHYTRIKATDHTWKLNVIDLDYTDRRNLYITYIVTIMRFELENIIREFENTQDLAIEGLNKIFCIKPPETAFKWADETQHQCHKHIKKDDWEIYVHGFGVEVSSPNIWIDFDWGLNGKKYGFDTDRLIKFSQANNIPLDTSYDELKSEMDTLTKNGEMRFSGYINYYRSDYR